MARIQILELPTICRADGTDETPFAVVIDEVENIEAMAEMSKIRERLGARAVLVFEETIEIPANEVTLTEATEGNVVRLRVEPDLTGFREQVMSEVARAQADAQAALQ